MQKKNQQKQKKLRKLNLKIILGIDEVGRGPWAGPLVMGACILREPIGGLTDSKKLSAKKREALAKTIHKKAFCGLGWVSAKELDKVGLSSALKLACRRAVEDIKKNNITFNEIVIDGTINFLADTKLGKYVTVKPKADLLVPTVSAASIIAKVARDKYMADISLRFPGYGFEKHVGYGTAAHRKAIEELGVCDEHRKSFRPIAELLGKQIEAKPVRCVTNGQSGEDAACEYLIKRGHSIIARNWRTKWCEIDIISEKDNSLFFTEVKYRKNDRGLDAITRKKQEQMRFAAELYLSKHENKSAQLAVISVGGKNFEVSNFLILE